MSCTPRQLSSCGTWELVRSETGGPPTSSGYGSQTWEYRLIVCATGEVWASWSGSASQSPWQADSHGVASVSWEGTLLVIAHCGSDYEETRIDRVPAASLPKSFLDPED